MAAAVAMKVVADGGSKWCERVVDGKYGNETRRGKWWRLSKVKADLPKPAEKHPASVWSSHPPSADGTSK